MSCRWALQERPLMAFCRPGPLAYHYFIRVDSGNWVWVWVWSWACGGYWSCPWVKHLLNVDCVPGTWLVTVHTLCPLTFTMTPCGRCHWTSFTDARLRSLTTATRQGQPGIPPVPFFYIPSLTNRKTFLLSLCPYNFSLLLEKTVILKVKDPLEDFSANYHLSVPDFCSDAGDTVSLLFSQME